jgi:hypothetical protein
MSGVFMRADAAQIDDAASLEIGAELRHRVAFSLQFSGSGRRDPAATRGQNSALHFGKAHEDVAGRHRRSLIRRGRI